MTRALDSYYYLTNFQTLLAWVNQHYQDLLSGEEQSFIETFLSLDKNSQCLFTRLISRKHNLFRIGKLNYPEISDVNSAAKTLADLKWATANPNLSIDEVSELLTKAELIKLFVDQIPEIKRLSKAETIERLSISTNKEHSWSHWTKNSLGELIEIQVREIVEVIILIFFGNPYQDLTDFVLADLGLFEYEDYQIDENLRVFKNRQELEDYRVIIKLRDRLSEAASMTSLTEILQELPIESSSIAIENRRQKLCNQLAYEFEKRKNFNTAYSLYEESDVPPSRERRCRILEKQHEFQKSWKILEEMLNQPVNENELQVALRIVPRLSKKIGGDFRKPDKAQLKEFHLSLNKLTDDEGFEPRVEVAVLNRLTTESSPCLYVENKLLNGLFGLWLWPEMFRSTQGAFANPFQSAPLDMYKTSFVQNRPGIQELWKLLDTKSYKAHFMSIWASKRGKANQFVDWQVMSEPILDLALNCIPVHHLKAIFKRMLFDLKSNRSGFPDLIQFYPSSDASTKYKMIEVKGPGDKLQDNQIRWLEYFTEHQIPAEVCYVSWRE